MRDPIIFTGCWYGEAIPEPTAPLGVAYAIANPGRRCVHTHMFAEIPFPPDEPGLGPLFVRCAFRVRPSGNRVFCFAGPSHGLQDVTWEWTSDRGWERINVVSVGPNSVIYDNAGTLHHSPGGAVGSMGYRYVDEQGRIWSSDETNGDPLTGIREYTKIGAVTIGQGQNGGTLVNYQGVTRVLEPGDCRYIRSRGGNNAIATTIHHQPSTTVVRLFGLGDIDALPVYVDTPPVVIDPPPPPVKEPPVSVLHVPNYASLLAEFHRAWNNAAPITDEPEKHRFTAAFAAFLNSDPRVDASDRGRFGRKSRASHGGPVSKDTLGYWTGITIPTNPDGTDGLLHVWDLISGGSGAISWPLDAERQNPDYYLINAMWYPVSAVAAPSPSDPPVDNPPATVDITAILSRLDVLADAVAEMRGELTVLNHQMSELRANGIQVRIDADTIVWPHYEGRLGMNLRLDPKKG